MSSDRETLVFLMCYIHQQSWHWRCWRLSWANNNNEEGACRVGKAEWQATRRPDANSMVAVENLWLRMSQWPTHWRTPMWARRLAQVVQQLNRQPFESQSNMTIDQLVQSCCLFQPNEPIAAETVGPLNESANLFFAELGRNINAAVSSDSRESSFFFQRIYVIIQRFSSILLHNSFPSDE